MRSIRNVRVCVVGGAGFLGSHLVNHLIEDRGCQVLVIDNLVAGRREFIHPKADFEHHDITGSEDYLRGIFNQYAVKYTFNYAAYPYVPKSYSRPVLVGDVNFMGAMKVINAAQESGAQGILQVSSAELYGDGVKVADWDPAAKKFGEAKYQRLTEDSPVTPHSSYGASKAAVDYYCQCAWRERKTPVIALRQFNCIGERETHPYVVPEIIGQLDVWTDQRGSSETPTVRLGNNSSRDFLYAGDAVRIAVELLERGEFGEVYNLGSEESIRIYDLARLIGKVMGFQAVTVEEDPVRKRPWEIWHLQSSNKKLHDAIAVEYGTDALDNLTTLEEALRRTVRWYEENGRKWPWEN